MEGYEIQNASNIREKSCRFENESRNANKNNFCITRRKKLQLRGRGLNMSQVHERLTGVSAPLEKEQKGKKLQLVTNSVVSPCSEIKDSEKVKLNITEDCDPIAETHSIEGYDLAVETPRVSGRSLPPYEKSVRTERKSNFAIQMKRQIEFKRYAKRMPSMLLLDFKDTIVSKSRRKMLGSNRIIMLGLQYDTDLILETVEEHNVTIKKPTVNLEKFCQSTPLHRACEFSKKNYGSKTIHRIQHLIRICPKLTSVQDSEGRTPLHYACATDAGVSVVDMLLQENDKMCMIADNDGRLPLHLARLSRPANPDVVLSLRVSRPGAAKVEDVFGMKPSQYGYCSQSTSPSSLGGAIPRVRHI